MVDLYLPMNVPTRIVPFPVEPSPSPSPSEPMSTNPTLTTAEDGHTTDSEVTGSLTDGGRLHSNPSPALYLAKMLATMLTAGNVNLELLLGLFSFVLLNIN